MKALLEEQGYLLIDNVFSPTETEQIATLIDAADKEGQAFRKTKDLFAIRRFLQEIPSVMSLVFTGKLKEIVTAYGSPGAFITKSIYFDKPEQSNWFVAYHQDLTISVDKKLDLSGFGPWTVKQDQFAVQPPVSLLEQNITIRIHLDDTDETNGALKVIPGSHRKGVYRPETIDWEKEQEVLCEVPRGGVMLMKPLLLHASARSTGSRRRRVIHIEFGNAVLPSGLTWSEQQYW